MLDDLQRLFRRTWDAFRTEAGKREPEDQVAELLGSMRREVVAARALLPKLTDEVTRTEQALAAERNALEQTERRGAMASRINDSETSRVAAEFAGRHRERVVVLEQRLAVSRAELVLRTREAEEMMRRFQEADANRFALLAQVRQANTRERMRSTLDGEEGAFADFRRMQESVDDAGAYAAALEELDDTPPPPPVDVEERLRELKRRMGRE